MIDQLVPVQVVEGHLRLHQRDARQRNRSQLCGSRAVDPVDGFVCICSRSFCIAYQVIVSRSFRVRGRRGIKGSRITEGQPFIISFGHWTCGTCDRTRSRAVPDRPFASYLFVSVSAVSDRNLLFPSYIDSGECNIVCVTVIGRILENDIRSYCLIVYARSASGIPQTIEP